MNGEILSIETAKKLKDQEEEIKKLNKIIGHALGYIESANKVDFTYVCKILKGSDKECVK